METYKLNKQKIKTKEYLSVRDGEFSEFVISERTVDEFFKLYEELFYDLEKQGFISHQYLVNTSLKYAGEPESLKDEEIKTLKIQIESLNDQILGVEFSHPIFKNGSVLREKENNNKNYLIQSGRRRYINNTSMFKLIKIRAGFGEDYDNDDFVTLVDQNAIYAIPESKYSISNQADLNISTRKINENK